MADATFLEVYSSVVPDHPYFAKCEGCEEMRQEGIDILSMAAALAEVCADNIMRTNAPPEVVDFPLSVLLSGTIMCLVGAMPENQDKTTSFELLPKAREVLDLIIARMPAEMERISVISAGLARTGAAGSC